MASPETDDEAADEPVYLYKPSLMGAAWQLRLKPEGLAWSLGRHQGMVRYERIRRVRLSYRPVTMQTHRFLAEIWSEDAPKITVASVSWRTIAEQERLDAAYLAFITELHRRIAASGGSTVFSSGQPLFLYGIGVVVFVGVLLAFAALTVRALQMSEWAGAAVVGGFFALFAWQVGNYFRRNRPGTYRADSLPADTLPRV